MNWHDTITDTALCGLGKSAALPVMSTFRLFRKEYEEHVIDKKCRSKELYGTASICYQSRTL
ncbi:MAG: NADH-ubiquinone oxidoreductase-F iron-sulfur binding region domain-containing protein [Anaerobutyricum soehngenii]